MLELLELGALCGRELRADLRVDRGANRVEPRSHLAPQSLHLRPVPREDGLHGVLLRGRKLELAFQEPARTTTAPPTPAPAGATAPTAVTRVASDDTPTHESACQERGDERGDRPARRLLQHAPCQLDSTDAYSRAASGASCDVNSAAAAALPVVAATHSVSSACVCSGIARTVRAVPTATTIIAAIATRDHRPKTARGEPTPAARAPAMTAATNSASPPRSSKARSAVPSSRSCSAENACDSGFTCPILLPVLEPSSQAAPCVKHGRADGARRHTKDFCDLRLRVPFDVEQHDRHAVPLGELVERHRQALPQREPIDVDVGQGPATRQFLVQLVRVAHRSPPPAVDGSVCDDPHQPGSKRARRIVPVEFDQRLEHSVLGRVLRLIGVPQDGVGQAAHRSGKPCDEHPERGAIAREGPRDQRWLVVVPRASRFPVGHRAHAGCYGRRRPDADRVAVRRAPLELRPVLSVYREARGTQTETIRRVLCGAPCRVSWPSSCWRPVPWAHHPACEPGPSRRAPATSIRAPSRRCRDLRTRYVSARRATCRAKWRSTAPGAWSAWGACGRRRRRRSPASRRSSGSAGRRPAMSPS